MLRGRISFVVVNGSNQQNECSPQSAAGQSRLLPLQKGKSRLWARSIPVPQSPMLWECCRRGLRNWPWLLNWISEKIRLLRWKRWLQLMFQAGFWPVMMRYLKSSNSLPHEMQGFHFLLRLPTLFPTLCNKNGHILKHMLKLHGLQLALDTCLKYKHVLKALDSTARPERGLLRK